MANTKSAEKSARVSERRRQENRAVKSRLHTLEGKFQAAVTAGDAAVAGTAFQVITSALDKAAKAKVIHQNTASRKKSRLAANLKKLAA